ncbi:autotransporter domain-containing protein [Morganella psychrotolerans]|uniref:Autotransporter outer membrane beta-barrel domain-containing protein n=1 Tax=Morganella psychrotolerans TaxID=368603 RepID=A0A1B8HUL7_9GAMM|nr:autotransporter domain-containing protein [Morganella psychrotolerans]OBU13567.1 autotransporter outer membrane beta-barrel domain-containing protein [Morganella psychrotolerans]
MRRKFLCCTVAALILSGSNAFAFDNFTVIGDSMSDGGNRGNDSRYLAGSYSKLYNEVLSEYYVNKVLKPSNFGGENYAEGGATADKLSLPTIRTSDQQIDFYLSRNGGHANKNGLYILWIGANDISHNVLSAVKRFDLHGLLHKGNEYLISPSADLSVASAKKLLDAGAGYVVVPSIPKAGLTPWTSVSIFSFMEDALGDKFDSQRLYREMNDELKNKGEISNEKQRQEYIVDAFKTVLDKNGVPVPRSIVKFYQKTITDMENRITSQFNYSVDKGLAKLNGNIIRADVEKLFDEIIFSGKEYGFDDVLVPVCQIGIRSFHCKEGVKTFHDDKVYLFSDWFHPSNEGHAVIAQYIASVIDAPYYATSLSKSLENVNYTHRLFLDGQLQSLRKNISDNKFSVFGGYSGRYKSSQGNRFDLDGKDTNNDLNLGFSVRTSPMLAYGGMVSISDGNFKVNDQYQYDYNGKVVSLFMQVSTENGLWGNINTSYGDMKLDDIERKIQLGKATRKEKGKTDANSFGVAVNAGYDYKITENITTGPVIGYQYDKYKVDGYRENSDTSTAMHFGSQKQERNIVSGGWGISTQSLPVNPYFEIKYNHNLSDKPMSVKGAVNSTDTSFTRTGIESKDSWVSAKLGASAALTENLNVFGVVNYNQESNHSNSVNYSVGLNYSF